MTSARARIPAVATADFVEACSGLVVTPEQRRYLQWFAETMDQPTLNAFADVIRLARAEQPKKVEHQARYNSPGNMHPGSQDDCPFCRKPSER